MVIELKLITRDRLKSYDVGDIKRRAHDDAKNGLESFIYQMKDFFDSSRAIEATEEAELSSFTSALQSAGDWLDDARDATTEQFKSKLGELKSLVDARYDHIIGRDAVKDAYVRATDAFKSMGETMTTALNKTMTRYTEYVHDDDKNELNLLNDQVKEAQKWVEESKAYFAGADPKEYLKVKAADLASKETELGRQIKLTVHRLTRSWESKKSAALAEAKKKAEAAAKALADEAAKLNATESSSTSGDVDDENKSGEQAVVVEGDEDDAENDQNHDEL